MFKQTVTVALLLLCATLSLPAFAVNNPYMTALISDPWVYSAFVYDPKENNAGWHKGELKFYPDNTVDVQTTDSTGNFDPATIIHLKYSLDSTGKISITPLNIQNPYPYIAGQISATLDNISAVVTSNNVGPNDLVADLSSGIVVLTRQSTVTFSNLDLMGQWGGVSFVNNGKNGFGWLSINSLVIDLNGHITGSDTRYDGKTGSFQGTALIYPNGQVSMTIADDQDPNYPIVMSAQMSENRNSIAADFNSPIAGQTSLGIGLMFKK